MTPLWSTWKKIYIKNRIRIWILDYGSATRLWKTLSGHNINVQKYLYWVSTALGRSQPSENIYQGSDPHYMNQDPQNCFGHNIMDNEYLHWGWTASWSPWRGGHDTPLRILCTLPWHKTPKNRKTKKNCPWEGSNWEKENKETRQTDEYINNQTNI